MEAVELVREATFEFTLGNEAVALELVERALEIDAWLFDGWHTKAEILYAQKKYELARDAAMQARKLNPEDIHINTSLSRIWVELGDKEKAEYFGAQARMLGWKEEISQPSGEIEVQ